MKLMRIYSDKFAASLELNGQGELVEAKSNTPHPAPPIALLTGHVLPMPNVAETANISGGGVENYVDRVKHAAGVPADRDGGVNVFAMMMQQMLNPVYDAVGHPKADGSNWPLIADAFWDRRLRKENSVYLTPEERAREQQAAQGNWGGNAPTPTPQQPAGGETDVPITPES